MTTILLLLLVAAAFCYLLAAVLRPGNAAANGHQLSGFDANADAGHARYQILLSSILKQKFTFSVEHAWVAAFQTASTSVPGT